MRFPKLLFPLKKFQTEKTNLKVKQKNVLGLSQRSQEHKTTTEKKQNKTRPERRTYIL